MTPHQLISRHDARLETLFYWGLCVQDTEAPAARQPQAGCHLGQPETPLQGQREPRFILLPYRLLSQDTRVSELRVLDQITTIQFT